MNFEAYKVRVHLMQWFVLIDKWMNLIHLRWRQILHKWFYWTCTYNNILVFWQEKPNALLPITILRNNEMSIKCVSIREWMCTKQNENPEIKPISLNLHSVRTGIGKRRVWELYCVFPPFVLDILHWLGAFCFQCWLAMKCTVHTFWGGVNNETDKKGHAINEESQTNDQHILCFISIVVSFPFFCCHRIECDGTLCTGGWSERRSTNVYWQNS